MKNSCVLFERAKAIIPGGVNSPVRAFKGVGGNPVFIDHGEGPYLFDVDGQRYIDYIGSWGPLILGHADKRVIDAMIQTMHKGVSFGAPTLLEIELAEVISRCMPSIEKIRMVNSGTEATMTAIRLARGFTNKTKVVKFEGCYHGHSDGLLVKGGSGLLTLGIPSSHGVLSSVAEDTLVSTFNAIEETTQLFEKHGSDIAAVIVEPIAGNMGLVLPTKNFLDALRKLCDAYGAVLIFDEVMTGFRVALGGAQALYSVTPDLTTLGKIIGGGLPVGAVGGRAEIMDCLAPLGGVYQAGTLSGNPLAMSAGLATLAALQAPGFYERLGAHTSALIDGLSEVTRELNLPFHGRSVGGMFGFFFLNKKLVENFTDVSLSDERLFNQFYHGMLQEGVYFAPSRFEAGFMSSAHTMKDINHTKEAAHRVLSACTESPGQMS
ncbi:MAG: glutamate-1-semialdehyde 2,1-aminomutase [Legionellaceae bacterium]